MKSQTPTPEDLNEQLARLTVLVVEDSEFDRGLIEATLKKIGINKIQIAENGAVGAAKLQTAADVGRKFDIIFLDSKMPSKNGVSLIKWIRGTRELRGQIVIITTGSSDPDSVQEFIQNGAQAFVIKPVTTLVLRNKILEVLQLTGKSPGPKKKNVG